MPDEVQAGDELGDDGRLDRSVGPESSRRVPADVFGRVGDIDAIDVAGGPVVIAAGEAYLLVRLGWFANPDIDVEVMLDGRAAGWIEQHIDPDDVAVRTAPDGRVRLGFPPARTVHDAEAYVRAIVAGFGELPAGARLDVITAAEGTPAGRMGFSATARGDVLEVWGSWPGVDAATLAGALALAREAEDATVEARDDREVEAVRARWKAQGLQRVTPLEVDGHVLGHGEGPRFTLRVAAALFAVRFGDAWECLEPDDPLAELGLDLEDELPSFETEDWPTGAVAFTGPESGRRYLTVFPAQLPDPVRAATQPILGAFAAEGAVHVGDTVCDINPALLIRAVANERARWFGVLMVAPYAEHVTELYSSFVDGSSLTTTTNPFGGLGGAEKGIHRNPRPQGTSVAELVAAHEEAIASHAAEQRTEVAAIRADLVGLAEALEEFLARQFS